MTLTPCLNVRAPYELSIITSTVSAILCAITIIGNLLVCLAVFKDPQKKLRTPFMFILVNLAIIDLIVGMVTLPISVVTHGLEAVDKKTLGHVTISRMFYFVTVTASTFNLIAFCVDRFIAVSHPIKYRTIMSFRICVKVVLVIWAASISIACIYLVVGYIDFIIVFAQISIALVFVMCIVTLRLRRMLNEKTKNRKRLFQTTRDVTYGVGARKESSGAFGIERQNERMTLLFLTFLWTFLLCCVPAIVMMYLIKYHVNLDCVVRHVIRDVSFLFVVSNSAFNPLVCTMRLKPFNEAIRIIFGFKAINNNGSLAARSPYIRRTQINNDDNKNKNQIEDRSAGGALNKVLWL